MGGKSYCKTFQPRIAIDAMRISTTSCLCPFLVCLCFVPRGYGDGHHGPAGTPPRNQSRPPEGETEVHHRPKRGWIWNQFFVLEEHIGPDAQYVGKIPGEELQQCPWNYY
ncbi:hypothetical protein Z043_111957 [Scleropages formosus]|uniref:Uncharacterized protein n=1 Tax=Scleropages formosus TaxID=113540 RepID=A0A0P7V3L6_SCLFO|nr:hypothetical protein Z043_111957 [Scleropages formosus]